MAPGKSGIAHVYECERSFLPENVSALLQRFTVAVQLVAVWPGELGPRLTMLQETAEANKSFWRGLAREAMISIFVVMQLDNIIVKQCLTRPPSV
jgi:hypothetical protein